MEVVALTVSITSLVAATVLGWIQYRQNGRLVDLEESRRREESAADLFLWAELHLAANLPGGLACVLKAHNRGNFDAQEVNYTIDRGARGVLRYSSLVRIQPGEAAVLATWAVESNADDLPPLEVQLHWEDRLGLHERGGLVELLQRMPGTEDI